MQQIYHSNAKTNVNIRLQIQNNTSKNSELARRFNVSKQTVSKWRNRDFQQDASSKPHYIEYALTEVEKATIVSLRKSTWLSLNEIFESILPSNDKISKSSVYRCLVKEKLNQVPKEKKDEAKKFKEYKPGYLHIDVTYLPKFKGQSYYLYVAIDRATRMLFYHIYENKTAESTEDFLDKCFDFFPMATTHILTDNGLEFTNSLIKSKKGEYCKKPSKMDIKCAQNNILHRLTKPSTPQTNGMVERVNGTIKNNTILKEKYNTKQEMEKEMIQFLGYYNMYRRHGSLKKELKVRTPLEAIKKWYEIEPALFKINPVQFENKLLNLITKNN